MYINFTIKGNSENSYGEPEPQKKAWADYVRQCFYDQFQINKTSVNITDVLADALNNGRSHSIVAAAPGGKPINVRNIPIRVWLDIEWAESLGNAVDTADTVLDALIGFPKSLRSLHFESRLSEDGRGKVNVIIRIE